MDKKAEIKESLKKGLKFTSFLSDKLNSGDENTLKLLKELFSHKEDHHIKYLLEKFYTSFSQMTNKINVSILFSEKRIPPEDRTVLINYVRSQFFVDPENEQKTVIYDLRTCSYIARWILCDASIIDIEQIVGSKDESEKYCQLGFDKYFAQADDKILNSLIDWVMERGYAGDFPEGNFLFMN